MCRIDNLDTVHMLLILDIARQISSGVNQCICIGLSVSDYNAFVYKLSRPQRLLVPENLPRVESCHVYTLQSVRDSLNS